MTTAPEHPACTRGPLISAEGLNGVGKTYLTNRAVEALTLKPVMLDEFSQRAQGRPGLGEALLQSLRTAAAGDPFLRGGTPMAEALILMAIKWHDLDTVLGDLARGRSVVEGRSVDTTAVCQALLLNPGDPKAALTCAVDLLDLAASYRPLPDLTILVTDDASKALERAQRRDRRAFTPESAERRRARTRAPISCTGCQAWGRGYRGLCRGCRNWGARARPVGDCVRCSAGPVPLREGWCYGCLRHRAFLGPEYDHVPWRQLRFTEATLDWPVTRTNLLPAGGKPANRAVEVGAETHRRQAIAPDPVPHGQQELFPAERNWSALRRAAPPEPRPEAARLLTAFDAHARAHAWTDGTRKAAAHVLRIAATWLGTSVPFADSDLRAISAATGRGSQCRPLALNAFLAERGLLLPQPRPATSSTEVFVKQVIDGYPPRIAGELDSWVRRLRSRPDRPPTDWRTMRRYLFYVKGPLGDWARRYQTLRQVTADDIRSAVTAVKGDRAHERAVALRSIFRALKQAKLIFTDPTRGVRVTRSEPPPTALPPDRLAGLLDITDRPAIRFALALVTVHALNGTDLARLTLGDVISARAQLLVRRPHGRHTVHLDEVTLQLLHTWLRYRHRRWPRTVNPHLFVTRQTVIHTGPASANYFPATFQRLGLTLNGLRTERILDEARDTADPVHLVRVFGISISTAMKYVHTAHPHRASIIPR